MTIKVLCAYFIAKSKLNEVEALIEKNNANNFNNILNVFSPVDSVTIKGEKAQLEDCIRKASIAIQRHPNSKWVDDSFILIGKARYYLADFVNAIETFKYVNTKSKDNNARHEALIALMRTFIDYNEDNNAIAVSDYLKKEKLNFENRKKLSLTRAYYYQRRQDYDNMVKYLVEAAPYLKKKENSDRIHFIIAQVYQLKGFDAEAYNYYSQCLKSNPSFELSFYSKLYMAEVTQLTEKQDIKKVRKYFRTLLRDRKNAEFKDKIYYEMGNFEMKQQNTDQAIIYYKLSVQSSINNPRQKGYSYLKLGELYFENFKKYELAKNYYDSVVSVLPKDDKLYEKISERQEVLADFVNQINTIQEQDSLLMLSRMDTGSLNLLVDKVIEAQNKKAEEEKRNQENIQQRNSAVQTNIYQAFNDNNSTTASSGSTWYFYNLNAVGIGQNEFKRIWGNRSLEDHWRRSNKESSSQFIEEQANTDNISNVPDIAEDTGEQNSNNRRAEMLAAVPYSEEAKNASLAKIENAYYNLGNIYNFKLDEKSNAAESFETLLSRFPETENEPEVRYLLYLIYGDLNNTRKREAHADTLLNKYPNSIFSKLVNNPNYREESNVASEKLKGFYNKAFQLYKIDSLKMALDVIKDGTAKYPDNDFSDNMKLLQILISGKIDGIYKYQYELQDFKNKYPDSELLSYVDTLINSSHEFQQAELQKKEIHYVQYLDQVHYFVIVYPDKGKLADQLPSTVEAFNKSNYSDNDLKIGNLIFDANNSMILVNEFPITMEAIDYYKKFNDKVSLLKENPSLKIYNFVISKDNFQILYQTKGLKEYMDFFHNNY